MPQKKARRQNGYFFFMRDFKRREEARGIKFQLGFKDVATFASDEWKNLPQYERDRYKQMAEEYNKSDQRAQGISAIGTKVKPKQPKVITPSMALLIKEKKKAAENHYIENLIQNMDPDQLLDHLFYLVHVNVFCKTDDDEYFPAEIAISKFTLRNGVLKVFHRFLNPGEIPMGYSYEVKVHSEKTHRIPLDIMKSNIGYLGMYQSILNFLQESNPGEIPPLYTMFDEPFHNCSMSAVKHSLKRIWETQNVEEEEEGELSDDEPYEKIFKVYSLPRLFFELKKKCSKLFNDGPGFSNTSPANLELLKDVYSFDAEIACKFHQENDNVQFCSQSYTIRWARVIRKQCCRDFADEDEEEEEEEETVPEVPPKDEKIDLPIKDEKDAIAVSNELPIKTEDVKKERDVRVKTEKDIKTERESRQSDSDSARVKTEKDRGYGDTSRVKTERDRGYERQREDDRIKSERDRGYDDRSRSRRDDDRGYDDRRSRRDDDVRVKTERDRGYDDRSRQRDDHIKSERDRGYDDRRSRREDDDRRSRRDDDVRVKSERDRGYDDRSRHRDDRIKSERDRGYDDRRREESSRRSKTNSPEIVHINTENATARSEQPSTSNAIKSEREPSSTESAQVRVKTEKPDDYYDSILKTEHIDIPYTPELKEERPSYENARDPRKRNDTQPSRDPRVQNAQAVSRDPRMRAAQAVPPLPTEVPSCSRIPSPVPVKQEKPCQAESPRSNSQKLHDFPLPIKVEKPEEPPASCRLDGFPMPIKSERPDVPTKNDFPLPKQIKTEKTDRSVPQPENNDFPMPKQIKIEKTERSVSQPDHNDFPMPKQIKTEKTEKSVSQPTQRANDFPLPIRKERLESQAAPSKSNSMSEPVRIKTERSPESSQSRDFPLPIPIKEERSPESRSQFHDFPLPIQVKTERPESSQAPQNTKVKTEPPCSFASESQKRKFDSKQDSDPKRHRLLDSHHESVKNELDYDECPPTPRRDEWCPPTPRRDECPPTPRQDECPPTPRRDEWCPPTPRREDFPDQQSTRIKSEPPDTYEIKQEEVHVESDGTVRVVKPDRNSHAEPMDCDWDLPMEVDDAGGKVIKKEQNNNKPISEKVKKEKIQDNVIIKDEMFHSHEDVD